MAYYLYYHKADLDGYVGGYMLKDWFLDKNRELTSEAIYEVTNERPNFNDDVIPAVVRNNTIYARPYNYGDKLDDDIADIEKLLKEDCNVTVYFVDCCPHQGEENRFERFYNLLGSNFIIIDHHATALQYIKKFEEEHGVEISGKLSNKYAGCELAAMYIMEKEGFFPGSSDEDKYLKINRYVKVVGTYDIYRIDDSGYDWNNEVLPFQYWLRAQCPNLEDLVTKNTAIDAMLDYKITPTDYIDTLKEGKAILSYLKTRNMRIYKENSHLSEVIFIFKGERIVENVRWATDYLNNSNLFSDNNDYNDPNIIYMLISPDLYEDEYKISLYSVKESKIDVGSIASKMGGGGHFHAAGFKASYVGCYDENGVIVEA